MISYACNSSRKYRFKCFTPDVYALKLTVLLLVSLAFTSSCGGRNTDLPTPETSTAGLVSHQTGMQAAQTLTQADIEQAGLEFSEQGVPPGVDPAVWQELGNALLDALEQRARETSKLPDEARNEIEDLAWIDNGGGDFNLEWSFRNAGDYDNNGEVNVSDLSSIGLHFGKNDSSADWDTARTADGDGNGEINIADVSPIGINFGSQVLGYRVYASDYEDGPWLLQGETALEDASIGYPRMFSYAYGAHEHPFVTVSPFDATDNDIVAATGGNTAKFIPGETTMGDSATVDNETSAVLEGEIGTPIEGVSVEIPAGAMYNPTYISIGYNEGTIRPVSGSWEGAILEIAGPTPLDFNEPVLITVPFNGGADGMLVPFYINDEMKPEACLVTDLDTGNGTMTFMTLHTSSYYWLRTGGLPESRTSNFDPSKHGFQIVNHGSTYEQSGECMGMSAFSGWYFEQQKTGKVKTDLFPSYYNTIGMDVRRGTSLRGQDAIATRAHISVNSIWATYLPSIVLDNIVDVKQWDSIRTTIVETGNPTIVYMVSPGVGAHVVLATGFTSQSLLIYDPNLPGREIPIGVTGGWFDKYETNGVQFSKLTNVGTGTMRREPFNNILADAEDGFLGSEEAKILDLNYNTGDEVNKRLITIAGRIESVSVLIENMIIDTGLSRIEGVVDGLTGEFSIDVPLQFGDNRLNFFTLGRNSDNQIIGVPNNYTIEYGLYLYCSVPSEKVKITLTWDQDNSFGMDVKDPWGETVIGNWMANPAMNLESDAGGYFAGSYESGGPLYFIIPPDGDDIPSPGTFQIRIRNTSTNELHGVVAANYRVLISYNEGVPLEHIGPISKGSIELDPEWWTHSYSDWTVNINE